MGDFSIGSRYNPKANFKSVRIGADSPLLEVELNELQDILHDKIKELSNTYFNDGILYVGSYTYHNNVLTIENEKAIIDGNSITISRLSLNLREGEKAYLKVWEELVDYEDTIYSYGNVQESTTEVNHILDERVGRETSKRIQLKYNLTKEKPVTEKYLELGVITNSKFKITSKLLLGQIETNRRIENIQAKENQTIITLQHPYNRNTNALQVYIDGIIQVPQVNYTELQDNAIQLNTPLTGKEDIVIIYNSYLEARARRSFHSSVHTKNGDDPIDILDLADSRGLLDKIIKKLEVATIDGGNFNDDTLPVLETVDGGYF